jgi:hypothetical protein
MFGDYRPEKFILAAQKDFHTPVDEFARSTAKTNR